LTGRTELKKNNNPLAGFGRLLTILAALAGAATAPAQVSLKTVVDLAQRNSAAVKMAEADAAKAKAAFEQTRDAYIPSVNFGTGIPAFPSVGFTGQPPSIYTMTVESLVFSIPQKRYMDAARSGWRAAEARLKDAREQVALDTSNAYLELDTVNTELAAARQQEEFANRLVEIERQRAEAGVDPLHSLLEAKLTAANMKLARLHLETRAATLSEQLAALAGLPIGSISPDRASIPEIPQIRGDLRPNTIYGIEAARLNARAKGQQATGDKETNYIPTLSFFAQYNRNTTILNEVNKFFAEPLPANNFTSGFNVQVPLLDMVHRAKGRESAADALRATAEAEQAERQNDVQIAEMTGTLRELEAQAEVASLKQQIAADDLKTVQMQMQSGNGAGAGPGAPAQMSPIQEQLALIDERQKYQDTQESDLNLAKARLGLLRALGHMQEWINQVHTK
jgi:outer membrane protein TolC